jgi:hypothetical protein
MRYLQWRDCAAVFSQQERMIMDRATKLVMLAMALAALTFPRAMQGASRTDMQAFPPFDPARGLVLRGTVVTMDEHHTVLKHGSVLVRNERIIAIWHGESPPTGTPIDAALLVDLGPSALIFPGLINLHNHPTYNMLRLWPPPSSDVEAAAGRPRGTEPYGNRYQWNNMGGIAPPNTGVWSTPRNSR